MMKWYFKNTWCGQVLMVLKEYEDDGRPYKIWEKATESESQKILIEIQTAIQKSKKVLKEEDE